MTIWTPELSDSYSIKYEAIADALARDIEKGTLKPGQKLPTQRALSRQLSVTVGTIGRAYALAEKRGYILLEVGRGSYVRSFESFSRETGQSQPLIDLGLNLPPATVQQDLLAQTCSRVAGSRDLLTLFGNAPVDSFEQHRVAAAQWLSQRVSCAADDVLICTGTQNALISALASLTRPGESVLVEELTFPGMIAAARLLNLNLIPIGMDRHGIIPEELERAAGQSSTLYCIPTNQNPTTVTMPVTRRKEIARIAATHDLQIIEDDVYGQLIENAPAPIAEWASERTFLVASLSKTMSVGLRLALVRVPGAFRESMIDNMRASSFFPPPLLCEIAANWITGKTASRLLGEQREISSRRRQIALEVLDHESFNVKSQGNHLWIKLPEAWSAETLERAASENGVTVYSAASFSVSPERIPNAIRIALGAARNESELRTGLNVIARLLNERSGQSSARY